MKHTTEVKLRYLVYRYNFLFPVLYYNTLYTMYNSPDEDQRK